jgi:ATP-dependent Clp protease ATP-binding subunit ClpX
MAKKKGKICSFCGESESDLPLLVMGQKSTDLICPFCVDRASLAIDIVVSAYEDLEGTSESKSSEVPLPSEILDHLNNFVVGQTDAKEALASAVYRHYRRRQMLRDPKVELPEGLVLQKSNILMVGPSGCGKTQLARALASLLDVPICIADATRFTEAGYIGDKVESTLKTLLDKSSWDVSKAEWGVVVIDEIDKLSKVSGGVGRDVGGEGVQQALLKLIEGGVVTIERSKPESGTVDIDTTNILFICMGAFSGLDKIVHNRLSAKAKVGFGGVPKTAKTSTEGAYSSFDESDLLSFGLIPELAGRLHLLVRLNPLTEDQLRSILEEPKDAILRQEKFFYAQTGVSLEFEPEALNAIVTKAKSSEGGARSLRGIVTRLLSPLDLKVAGKHNISSVKITKDCVLLGADPVLVLKPTVEEDQPPALKKAEGLA